MSTGYHQRQPEIATWLPKTGNSYVTGTTTDSVEIPTASRVFLTITGPNNVSRSYCDNVRQPEIALRPTKPLEP